MAELRSNSENEVPETDVSAEQPLEQQSESSEIPEKDISDTKSTTSAGDALEESPTATSSGRSSRQRKNSTPNTPVSTPPSSRQITPPPSTKQTPTPSPGGSTTSKPTPTPSPAESSSSKQSASKLPVRVGIQWKTNSRVEAKDFLGKWYPAKILEVDSEDICVRIHFEGWNNRYDEWIRMDSDRLRPATRHSERKEKREKPLVKAVSYNFIKQNEIIKLPARSEHKVNECVFAKWTDCRMYAARIINIKANGAYEVVFYDGFKKTVQPINIKPMPPDVQEQYGIAGWLPPPIKKNKLLKREDLMAPKMKEEVLNKQKKVREREKEAKKQQQQQQQQQQQHAAASATIPSASSNEAAGETEAVDSAHTEDHTQEAQAVKDSEGPKDKETSAKRRSTSTEKQPPETKKDKKEVKREKINVSKTGVKTKGVLEVIRSRLHEVQRSKIKQAREDRAVARSNSSCRSEPKPEQPTEPVKGEGNKKKRDHKSGSPLKRKKLKVGGGFMFQTKRARIDALAAKINKAKEQRRHSAPAPATTMASTTPVVETPAEETTAPPLPEPSPELPAEESSLDLAKDDIELLGNSDSLVTDTQTCAPQPVSSHPVSGKKKPQPLSITTSSGEQASLVPLIPKSAPPKVKEGFPKKAFKVEEDHNRYKCPLKGCNKGFRKQSLVDYHIKYYHTSDGTPVRPPPPRKRKKTISVCSTDSEISVGSHIHGKKKMKRDRGSGASLSSIPDTPLSDIHGQSSFDDSMTLALSEDGRTSTTEEMLPTECADEETVSCDEFYDKMEDEDFVNCICQIQEENGLMIQCDVCLCWQHAVCMEITQETLPKKYVCYVCANPPGSRDSARFIYNQDWHREGSLARFNFLPVVEDTNGGRQSPSILATHNLVGDVHNVNQVLHGLRKKIAALNSKKGREFHLWTKDWDREMEKIEEDNTKDIEQKDNTDEINLEVKTEGSEIKDVVTEVEVKTEPDVTEIEIKVEADLEEPVTDHQSQNGDQTNKDRAVESTAENMETESQKLGKENESKEQMNGVKEETPPDEESNAEKAREVVEVTLQEAAEQGPSTSSSADSKNMTESLPNEEPQPSTSKLQEEEEIIDPTSLCENNLLRHIISTQDMIDTRLDDIETQLDELESLESNGARPIDILRDVPALKKAIHNLMNDLTKVKRMARFH